MDTKSDCEGASLLVSLEDLGGVEPVLLPPDAEEGKLGLHGPLRLPAGLCKVVVAVAVTPVAAAGPGQPAVMTLAHTGAFLAKLKR